MTAQPTISQTAPRIADFNLKPFMASSDLRAIGQVLSVLLPYGLLWYAAHAVHDTMPWLVLPIAALMVLFLSRTFALMHDCGHYSLFRRKYVNRACGFLFGVVTALPQYPWSRGHAYHHAHNGNRERYRGPAAVIRVDQFQALSPWRKKLYALLRHPLMLFPGGLFYLLVKSRLQLLAGLLAYIPHLGRCLVRREWRQVFAYKSKFWYTNGEFWDILFNNICVILLWYLCGELMGHAFFWSLYAPVMMVAAALFICVFYIQHNFAESYAHRDQDWSYLAGALEGSSYFVLPPLLNWFTADIGYHNIHHLCARIPNYRLAACHRANAHLLTQVKILRMRDIPTCYGYILWDAENDRLTTIAEVRARESTPPLLGAADATMASA